MALTKVDIIGKIVDQCNFSKKQATDVVEQLLEIIKANLESGDDVMVSGFGKFCVNTKKERRGRNPATGDDMMLRERKVVGFKWSGKLRDTVNGK